MRQKKSNIAYYIVAATILVAIAFVVFHEVPLKQEHIEEVIK